MTGSNHVDALQTPVFSHSELQIGCCRKPAGKTLGNHYFIFSMVLFSFPFLPKGAAAGLNCNLEDIRLTGGLMSSLSLSLQNTSTCHGSRAVTWLRPKVASPIKLVKSKKPSPEEAHHSPWDGKAGGLCAQMQGLSWGIVHSSKANASKTRETQEQQSWAERELPLTEVLLGSCVWAQNPLPATTKVCLCSKDLQNAASVKATPGR